MIRVEGSKGMAVQFAKCCNPMPGHPVLGYVTKSHAVTIHRADCKSFAKSHRDPARVLQTSWEGEDILETSVRVIIGARPNVLADITNALRPMNTDIISAQYGPLDTEKGQFDFVFVADEQKSIDQVMRTLRTVSGVSHVTQLRVHQRPVQRLAETG